MNKFQENFNTHVKALQQKVITQMQKLDPKLVITEDRWEREDYTGKPGGGGITCALEGELFKNAGVNTSMICGEIDPAFAIKLKGNSKKLWAAGISLIIHPQNPRIPTIHANFRMIVQGDIHWFGGGADLTPYYPHLEDFKHFHGVWQKACAPYENYQEMKEECDRYFTNTHRGDEMRGVGGIFFDHLDSGDLEKDYDMVTDLSNHFIESYFPLVERRKDEDYCAEDVTFQRHRHGRYVEFNLIHDRGTLFGLKTKGRIDSILISLPRDPLFTYGYAPKKGSKHEEMMGFYRQGINW